MLAQCRHGSAAVAVKMGADSSRFDLGTFKVLRIRKQIEHRTYDLEGRLDAVLEKILQELSPSKNHA
jgi:hypothetical protein